MSSYLMTTLHDFRKLTLMACIKEERYHYDGRFVIISPDIISVLSGNNMLKLIAHEYFADNRLSIKAAK